MVYTAQVSGPVVVTRVIATLLMVGIVARKRLTLLGLQVERPSLT